MTTLLLTEVHVKRENGWDLNYFNNEKYSLNLPEA